MFQKFVGGGVFPLSPTSRGPCAGKVEREVALGLTYPQHDAVLDVQEDLLLLPVVSDQGVERVAVWHPTNQARVCGERNHRVALDAEGKRNKSDNPPYKTHFSYRHTKRIRYVI